jgi:hypothetical protein
VNSLLLAALLFAQGIPVTAAQSGKIAGVLRGADGKPLAGVRVAAVIQPETLDDRTSGAMSGLAETDEAGHFLIEGIPQGRYYVAAGRVDFPTYFPGTLDMSKARIVTVMPSTTVAGIDFAMSGDSERPFLEPGRLGTAPIATSIALKVRMADGSGLPVFVEGKFPLIRLDRTTASARLMEPNILISGGDYTVVVENLPSGYSVQSMTYGTDNLLTSKLKVPYAFASVTGAIVTLSGATAQPVPVQRSTIEIVLKGAPPPSAGIRVTGRAPDMVMRSVYLSGTPGTYFSDGTFEFNNVTPGLHVLAGLDTPIPLGALVTVGDQGVKGIELKDETAVLPFNLRSPRDPEPVGNRAPASVLPLPTLKGIIREEDSKKPLEGKLKLTGYARSQMLTTGSDGRFEIPRLFPGSYTLEFELFGHGNITETVNVGTENITLDLTSRRLY